MMMMRRRRRKFIMMTLMVMIVRRKRGFTKEVSHKEFSLVRKNALISLKPILLFSYFCDRTLFDWLDDRS